MSEIVERLAELNPDALLFEPRTVFDVALIGMTDKADDYWPRKESPLVAVYDEDKCIKAIMKWLDCDYGDALDYYSFNTAGAWIGENTPTIICQEDLG